MGREPLRTCSGCRTKRPKDLLLRVTRATAAGVRVDPGGKAGGRGAYVCRDAGCVQKATRKGALGRALGVALAAEDLARLRTEMEEEVGA